ncbi:MAG: C10 family peptidase [Chloroflexi bacterium]|nr:C10 family peptidase [Chloroflexota bacterium]
MRTIRNNMSKICWCLGLLLALCLALVPTAKAGDIGEAEVRTAVETWVRYVTADARPDAVVERMEPYQVDGETVAYIAHLEGGGFCLCGADDLVLPVYFYSPRGTYDPENPNYQYILWEIGTRLEYLQKGLEERDPRVLQYRDALSERATFWQDLIAGRIPRRVKSPEAPLAEPEQMELNLTSRWDQRSPYNNLCPMGDGGRTVVGCVATAAAQIMRYWNWPPSGTGSHSYTWDGDQSCGGSTAGGTLSATFSDAYDWQNMPDDCTGGCSPAQQDALSELSYEAGVAVEMDYGACGSGAAPAAVQSALENHFRYDTDTTYGAVNTDTMATEIQWLRPFHFRGTNAGGGGHSWLVFGYNKGTDPAREFLMNMGQGDDYTTHPHGWYSCDNVPGGHTIAQSHTTWIAPENAVKFVGAANSGDGSPDDPYEGIEEAITEAADGATLIFKAGSDNTFSAATLIIDRPFILKGKDVTIRKE